MPVSDHGAFMALPPAPAPFTDADYEMIADAVLETARGRWFLTEHARRNRNADTKVVLEAIEKLERLVAHRAEGPEPDRVRVDLVEMMNAITRTKAEIASMRPSPDASSHFDQASNELGAIVGTTEKATSDILASAERVQEIAWTLREQGVDASVCDLLDANATEVYAACSFQDLTGQRIRKVVEVLRFLEARIDAMIKIWRMDDLELVPAEDAQGIQQTARGLQQEAVDDIIGGERKPDVVWRETQLREGHDPRNLGEFDLDDLEVFDAPPDAPEDDAAVQVVGNGKPRQAASPPTVPAPPKARPEPAGNSDSEPSIDTLTLAERMALFA